jgi:hypothetical protein
VTGRSEQTGGRTTDRCVVCTLGRKPTQRGGAVCGGVHQVACLDARLHHAARQLSLLGLTATIAQKHAQVPP